MAKYGDQVDADVLFNKRVKDGLFTLVFVFFIMLMMTKTLSFLNLIICFAIGYFIFKSGYTNLKTTIKTLTWNRFITSLLFKEFGNINSTLHSSSST